MRLLLPAVLLVLLPACASQEPRERPREIQRIYPDRDMAERLHTGYGVFPDQIYELDEDPRIIIASERLARPFELPLEVRWEGARFASGPPGFVRFEVVGIHQDQTRHVHYLPPQELGQALVEALVAKRLQTDGLRFVEDEERPALQVRIYDVQLIATEEVNPRTLEAREWTSCWLELEFDLGPIEEEEDTHVVEAYRSFGVLEGSVVLEHGQDLASGELREVYSLDAPAARELLKNGCEVQSRMFLEELRARLGTR